MNDILKTVLSLSVSGSIIAIILFAVKPFLKNRISKTWQYYIWLVVILRLLIPLTSEISILNGLFNSTAINNIAPIDNVSPNYQISDKNLLNEVEITQNTMESSIVNGNISSTEIFDCYLSDIQEYGWFVWLFVSAILLLKQIISYHVYTRHIKSNRKLITDESIITTYGKVCEKAGITRDIGIYSYKSINSPMLIGFVKPYILLPETILKEIDSLQYILLHELTHYRRLDFLYKCFVQIAVCVHFFNPVVYLVRNSINKACEFSCDEMVIKKFDGQSKIAYGTALIDALELSAGYNQHAISFMLCEDMKIIKERLEAIMNYKRSSKLVIVFTIFLTAMFSLGAMFTGVYAQAKVTEPKNVLENNKVKKIKYIESIKKDENSQQSSNDNLLMNNLSPYRLSEDQLTDNLKSWIDDCDKKQDLYVTSKNDRWYIYCNSILKDYAWKIDNDIYSENGIIVNLYDIDAKGDGYALLSIPHYDNIQVLYKDKKVQFTDDNNASNSDGEKADFDNYDFLMKHYQTNAYTADNYKETINGYEASLQFANFTGSKVIYEFDLKQDIQMVFRMTADIKYLKNDVGEYKIAFITENNQIIRTASTYKGLSAERPIDCPKGKLKVVLIGEQISGDCMITLSSDRFN